ISRAILFLTACFAATVAGWALALVRFTLRRRSERLSRASSDLALPIFRYSITFERFFLYYAIASATLLLLQLSLLLSAGIGATSVVYARAYAPLYRIAAIMNSTGFMPFFALARRQNRRNTRVIAVYLILLQLALALATTSKGTLLTM